ncbi:hypothetical protein EDB83DRAFT_2530681 [Lactarius deliciosus]|nr:hypothetical protein EDB83DRAFT_2530681 [Lactarius deliciosus]
MYDIPSAVSEQASVRCSNMEEYYVCPLPRSSTRPTFFSTRARYARPGRGHSQLADEERSEIEGNRLVFVLEVDPVPRENAQAFSEGPRPMTQ